MSEAAMEAEAGSGEEPRDAVLVFVREPVAGRVKTRLAAAIGTRAALRVYTRLAERAVRAALGLRPAVEARVHYTPAGGAAAVRRWLGEGPVYLAQPTGDLGERMEHAFRAAFREGRDRVLIIGSDLPAMSAELLDRAFAVLHDHPVVIGPATDGGYYLLGLRGASPALYAALFQGVPWSTDGVLRCTLRRLRGIGIEPVLLEPLRDVDHAADLPPELREAGGASLDHLGTLSSGFPHGPHPGSRRPRPGAAPSRGRAGR